MVSARPGPNPDPQISAAYDFEAAGTGLQSDVHHTDMAQEKQLKAGAKTHSATQATPATKNKASSGMVHGQ